MNLVANEMETHMTRSPIHTTAEMPAIEALELMQRNGIRHLPVTDGERITGVVSERDLLRASEFTNLLVADAMTKDVFVAGAKAPLLEVAQVMTQEKYGCAIVVNERLGVQGIFTRTDALKLLISLLKEKRELEKEYREKAIESLLAWDADWQ